MRTLLLLPLIAAATLGLAACSTGSPTTTAGTGGVTPASASPVPTTPAAHSSGPIDVCGDFPVSTIVAATGRSVYTTATERDGDSEGAKLYACEYTDASDPANALDGFNLVVYRGGDPTRIMTDLATAQTSGATPTSGIGDRAQLGAGEMDVVVGSDVVVASDALHEGNFSDVDPATLKALAQKLIAKL